MLVWEGHFFINKNKTSSRIEIVSVGGSSVFLINKKRKQIDKIELELRVLEPSGLST